MVKLLSFRFQQCFSPFTMLLVERPSKKGLFGHLSNHVFRSPSVRIYISYEGHLFFWKCSKLNLNLQNPRKKKKGPLKRDCLDIYLTMSFGLRKFINTWAMAVIHYLKMFKIESKFIKCNKKKKKKLENIFFVSEKKACQNVAINCLC